jgi:protein involved in polysaccharide export with SLBB domain
MKHRLLLVVLSVCFIAFIWADTTRISPDDYIVKIGDVFSIQYMTVDTLSIMSPVLPAGVISLFPFADTVFVAGSTLTGAYEQIGRKLGPGGFRDKILIQLAEVAPTRFHIMGAVVNSGEYISEELVSLHQALNLSGGIAAAASKVVRILRKDKLLTYDLNDYFLNHDISQNPIIMHDDVIIVNYAESFVKVFTNNDTINYVESIELKDEGVRIREIFPQLAMKHKWSNFEKFTIDRGGVFYVVDPEFILEPFDRLFIPVEELYVYVTGFVVSPGRFPYNGSLDAIYYISQSGGPTQNGARGRAYIIRQHGTQERYRGQLLKPGDTLYIPESYQSMFVSYLGPLATVVSVVSTIVIISVNLGR